MILFYNNYYYCISIKVTEQKMKGNSIEKLRSDNGLLHYCSV